MRQSKLIILICLAVSAASILYVLLAKKTSPPQTSNYSPPVALADQGTSVGSSDGKFTITMKTQKGKDQNTYVFSMKNEEDGSVNQIFSKSLPVGSSMIIPQNTFSPDDKYIFLQENDPSGVGYIALNSSGSSIGKDSQTLDLSGAFAAKFPNYKLTEATGWGGMNLIVFNTDKVDGGIGPSFWFEVPSGAFIPLSTRFN